MAGLTAVVAAVPVTARNCRIRIVTGTCIFIPASERVDPEFAVGDEFPTCDHGRLIGIDRDRLPPADGAGRCHRSGHDI